MIVRFFFGCILRQGLTSSLSLNSFQSFYARVYCVVIVIVVVCFFFFFIEMVCYSDSTSYKCTFPRMSDLLTNIRHVNAGNVVTHLSDK